MGKKIKVLHYIFRLNQGGAETLVKDYALLLNKERFDVVVLCHKRIGSPYEKILYDAGIKVLYLSDIWHFKPNSFICKVVDKICRLLMVDCFCMRKIIHKERPDVIHSHLQSNFFIKFCKPPKTTKLFYTVHSQPKAWWFSGMDGSKRDLSACKDLVSHFGMQLIALNDPMRDELNSLFQVKNTIVLNNGIDFKRFIVDESKEEIRGEIGIPPDRFLVGHVGRFCTVKNHVFIIDVFKQLLEKKPNSHLLLVGEGELRTAIENKIKKMGITEHVTMLKSRTDIPRIMKCMDVFIFPSLYEGLGIVLIEAQKMKTHCVISSAIPSAAVVSNYVNRMPPDASLDKWVSAILKSHDESIEYYDIEKWDMNNVIHKLESLYSEK